MRLSTCYGAAASGAEDGCDIGYINLGPEEGAGDSVIHGILERTWKGMKCPES